MIFLTFDASCCFQVTNRKLSSQIDGVERSLDESLENTSKTKQEVGQIKY